MEGGGSGEGVAAGGVPVSEQSGGPDRAGSA